MSTVYFKCMEFLSISVSFFIALIKWISRQTDITGITNPNRLYVANVGHGTSLIARMTKTTFAVDVAKYNIRLLSL